MDNIMRLYTTTEGRIGRQRWWIGVLILVVVNILISLVILPLVGVSMMPNMAAVMSPDGVDAAAVSQAIANGITRSAWASLVLFVIFAYPGYALSVKRRHDKDNNGMDVLIYMGLTFVVLLLQALGIGWETMTVNGITFPTPSMWLNGLNLIVGIYAIYLLVMLGFLKGTTGENSFGPDPLGSS